MKYRNGLVSNSSSSSFIAIGKLYNENDLYDNEKDKAFYLEGIDKYLIGQKIIASYDIESISLQKINDIAQTISNKHNINLKDIDIIYGPIL